jgi:hypothetical protein
LEALDKSRNITIEVTRGGKEPRDKTEEEYGDNCEEKAFM